MTKDAQNCALATAHKDPEREGGQEDGECTVQGRIRQGHLIAFFSTDVTAPSFRNNFFFPISQSTASIFGCPVPVQVRTNEQT